MTTGVSIAPHEALELHELLTFKCMRNESSNHGGTCERRRNNKLAPTGCQLNDAIEAHGKIIRKLPIK